MEAHPEEAGRDVALKKLLHRPFRGFHFTAQDAIVAPAPLAGGPAPPVRARLDQRLPHRLYPADSGFLVKWPYYEGEDFDPLHFQLERGGWDHEHCEVCGTNIGTGDECWHTDDKSTSFLCGRCYDRLCELADA